MNIVKVGGLLLGFVTKSVGVPFSGNLSMLVEELTKSSAEMKEALQRIEQLSKGQVLGWANAAKVAMENASSIHLSNEEKLAEIKRAKELFEKCYGDLLEIEFLSGFRGEISFYIAVCNAALGINDRRDFWLKTSVQEFLAFGNSNAEKDLQIKGSKEGLFATLSYSLGGIALVTVGSTGIGLLPLFVIVATSQATGIAAFFKFAGDVEKTNEEIEELLEQKQYSLEAAEEVSQVIALLSEVE